MTCNRSLPSQARWTLIALLALSLLPASLRAQTISSTPVQTDADAAKLPASTEGVSINWQVTIAGARSIARLPGLKAVFFNSSPSDVVREVLSVRSFESISIYGSKDLKTSHVEGLAAQKKLTTLVLSGCHTLTSDAISYAARSGLLNDLTVTDCPMIGNSGAMSVIATLPLVKLRLIGGQFNVGGLRFAKTAKLAALFLGEVGGIDDAFVARLKGMPLTDIRIYSQQGTAFHLTDKGFAVLAGLAALETLRFGPDYSMNFDTLPDVSDKGVAALCALTKLRELILPGLSRLTDVGAVALAGHDGLQVLELSANAKTPATGLTSKGVMALMRSKTLRTLILCEQTKIKWNAADDYSIGQMMLEVYLAGSSIDDKTLLVIAENSVKATLLKFLAVGSPKVTKAGLDAAKKANPKLQVDWREEEDGAGMGLPG